MPIIERHQLLSLDKVGGKALVVATVRVGVEVVCRWRCVRNGGQHTQRHTTQHMGVGHINTRLFRATTLMKKPQGACTCAQSVGDQGCCT